MLSEIAHRIWKSSGKETLENGIKCCLNAAYVYRTRPTTRWSEAATSGSRSLALTPKPALYFHLCWRRGHYIICPKEQQRVDAVPLPVLKSGSAASVGGMGRRHFALCLRQANCPCILHHITFFSYHPCFEPVICCPPSFLVNVLVLGGR